MGWQVHVTVNHFLTVHCIDKDKRAADNQLENGVVSSAIYLKRTVKIHEKWMSNVEADFALDGSQCAKWALVGDFTPIGPNYVVYVSCTPTALPLK